jgi:hypothetical protein
MQHNVNVDQQHLQQLLSTHQTVLTQTDTSVLAAIQKKTQAKAAFDPERQELVAHQQSFLDEVATQYKDMKIS